MTSSEPLQPADAFTLVIVGHVDHGKSTVMGRLLADTGALPQGRLAQVEDYCRRHARPFEYAYLLDALEKRPDGDGTMLDTSLVVVCSEVSDGNTHSHHDMPFLLAGRANGRLSTGRALAYENVRHSNLLSSIAHAMGQEVCFGQECGGPLSGLLA